MAKKIGKQHKRQESAPVPAQTKSGSSLKELLSEEMLGKLKGVGNELKAEQERKTQAEAERKRKEAEEREKNKSFEELLQDFDKKGGGKYS